MFQEKELTLKEIAKINDGLTSIMNAESQGEGDKKENILPFKASYKIGRFMDQLEKPIERLQKEVKKALDEAEKEVEKIEKKKKFDSNRNRIDKKREIFDKKIESLNQEKETVKVLEKPMTEDEFGEFNVPSNAFRCLGDFINIE